MSAEEFETKDKSQDELETQFEHELAARGLSRGQVVKGGMALAAAIGLGTLFAACGGDDDQAAPAPPEEAPAPPEEAPAPPEAAPAPPEEVPAPPEEDPPPPEEAVAPRQVNLDLEGQVYYMMAANQQGPLLQLAPGGDGRRRRHLRSTNRDGRTRGVGLLGARPVISGGPLSTGYCGTLRLHGRYRHHAAVLRRGIREGHSDR